MAFLFYEVYQANIFSIRRPSKTNEQRSFVVKMRGTEKIRWKYAVSKERSFHQPTMTRSFNLHVEFCTELPVHIFSKKIEVGGHSVLSSMVVMGVVTGNAQVFNGGDTLWD